MNLIDIIIIIFVIVLCIRGYLKGFVNELFSLLIIGIGLTVAFLLYQPLSQAFGDFIENDDLALILSFFSIFVLVVIFLIIVRNILIQFVERMNLTDIDSFLGLIVGLFKGLIICGAILVFLRYHSVLRIDRAINRSLLYPFLERTVLLLTGRHNRVFTDSNIETKKRLDELVPGHPHELLILEKYGHQDPFMGERVAAEVYPQFLPFLEKHTGLGKAKKRKGPSKQAAAE